MGDSEWAEPLSLIPPAARTNKEDGQKAGPGDLKMTSSLPPFTGSPGVEVLVHHLGGAGGGGAHRVKILLVHQL